MNNEQYRGSDRYCTRSGKTKMRVIEKSYLKLVLYDFKNCTVQRVLTERIMFSDRAIDLPSTRHSLGKCHQIPFSHLDGLAAVRCHSNITF